jgi:hypothetical protein
LGTIDPDVTIERMIAGPQAGDLAVPPFVGREWRVEEREAERRRRWGPPQPRLTRGRAIATYATLAVALSAAVAQLGLGLTPDRYVLVLLVPALVLGQPKRYLADFIPFALLLILYSTCRGLAHTINPQPFYRPQLDAEKLLFAGHVPTVALQRALGATPGTFWPHVAIVVTKLHFIVPPLLGFVLWTRRRALFYRFAATMLALSFAAAVVFLAFPAAPPWAAAQAGLAGPLVHVTHARESVSAGAPGLAEASVARLIPKNPYAAVPSLHAGYAFLVFLFVAALAWRTPWRRWIVPLAALYPLLEITAVVYTGDHYVVDTVLGCLSAGAAFWGVARFWRARGLPE